MTDAVSVSMVSRILVALLQQYDWLIEVTDRSDDATYAIAPEDAAAADGFLPVFLRAADGVWRQTTGKSFGIDIRHSATATLGYEVKGIASGPASVVMLCMMEAMETVAEPERLLINDLRQAWQVEVARRPEPAAQAAE